MKLSLIPMLLSLPFGLGEALTLANNANTDIINYYVSSNTNKLFGLFERSFDLETGCGEKHISSWLNDKSYELKFPFVADDSLTSANLSGEELEETMFVTVSLTKYVFNYSVQCVENNLDVVREVLDRYVPYIYDFRDFLNDFSDGSYEAANEDLYRSVLTLHEIVNDVFLIDNSVFFSNFRNYLYEESFNVSNGLDNSFDQFVIIEDNINFIKQHTLLSVDKFTNGAKKYYKRSNESNNYGAYSPIDILAYLDDLDDADFVSATEDIIGYASSSGYNTSSWSSLSKLEKISFIENYFDETSDKDYCANRIFERLKPVVQIDFACEYAGGLLASALTSLQTILDVKTFTVSDLGSYFSNYAPTLYCFLDVLEAIFENDVEPMFLNTTNTYFNLNQTVSYYLDSDSNQLDFAKEYAIGRMCAACSNDRIGRTYSQTTFNKLKTYITQVNSLNDIDSVTFVADKAVKDLNTLVKNENDSLVVLDSDIGDIYNIDVDDPHCLVVENLNDQTIKQSLADSIKADYANESNNIFFNLYATSNHNDEIYKLDANTATKIQFNRASCWNINVYRSFNGAVETLHNGLNNKNAEGEYYTVEEDSITLHTSKLGSYAIASINSYFEIEIAKKVEGVTYKVEDSTTGTTLSIDSSTSTDNIYLAPSLHDIVVTFTCNKCYSFKNANDSIRIIKCLSSDMIVGVPTVVRSHSYEGAPTYTWDKDKCTATILCATCGADGKITETKVATYVKDLDATCEECEKGHYEVTFVNEHFAKQVTDFASVDGEKKALGHNFIDGECSHCHMKEPNSKEKLTITSLFTILIIALLVLLVGALLFILIRKNKKNQTEQQ